VDPVGIISLRYVRLLDPVLVLAMGATQTDHVVRNPSTGLEEVLMEAPVMDLAEFP
jgi:hypothetical protein